MAEINPSIILAGLSSQQQQPSFAQNASQGLALAGQIQQNRLAPQKLALQEQQQAFKGDQLAFNKDKLAQEQTLKTNQLAFDRKKQSDEKLKQDAEIKKILAEATGEQLENTSAKLQIMGSLAGSVVDQPTLELARARAEQEGLDISQIPKVFNPESQGILQAFQRSALSEQDVIENEISKRGEDTKSRLAKHKEDELGFKREELAFKKGRTKEDFNFAQEKLTNQLPEFVQGKQIKGRVLTQKKVDYITDLNSHAPAVFNIANTIIDELGKGGIASLPDSRKAALQTELRQLQAILKSEKFINLGVLTGPDLDFLDDITGDPTRFTELINIFGGEERVKTRLESLIKNTRRQTNDKLNARGFESFNEKDFSKLQLEVNFGSEEEARRAGKINGNSVIIGGVRGVLN